MQDLERRTATLEEVQAAIEALDEGDWLDLWRSAVRMSIGTSYRDPKDLVQDALESALRLKRRWKMEHSFPSFICGAMKSIASNDRGSLKTRSEQVAAALADPDAVDSDEVLIKADAEAQLQRRMPEQAAAAAQAARQRRVREVYELFADDPEITMILMAMEDGCRGADILLACGFTATQHDTARRRMRRKLLTAFPQGGS